MAALFDLVDVVFFLFLQDPSVRPKLEQEILTPVGGSTCLNPMFLAIFVENF